MALSRFRWAFFSLESQSGAHLVKRVRFTYSCPEHGQQDWHRDTSQLFRTLRSSTPLNQRDHDTFQFTIRTKSTRPQIPAIPFFLISGVKGGERPGQGYHSALWFSFSLDRIVGEDSRGQIGCTGLQRRTGYVSIGWMASGRRLRRSLSLR